MLELLLGCCKDGVLQVEAEEWRVWLKLETLVFPVFQSGAEPELDKGQMFYKAVLISVDSFLCVSGVSAG